jgi:hypothetical protein
VNPVNQEIKSTRIHTAKEKKAKRCENNNEEEEVKIRPAKLSPNAESRSECIEETRLQDT